MPNGSWTLGQPPPAEFVASATVVSSGGVIAPTEVWASATVGSYDVLLISGACGAQDGAIVAAFDAGTAAGFDVSAGADPIPALSRGAVAVFVMLLIALGAWLLAGRRA